LKEEAQLKEKENKRGYRNRKKNLGKWLNNNSKGKLRKLEEMRRSTWIRGKVEGKSRTIEEKRRRRRIEGKY